MVTTFKSQQQKQTYDIVKDEIQALGYTRKLLQEKYNFTDWFDSNNSERQVPLAAFGQSPFSYDSACLAAILSNGKSGKNLVNEYRALGAPLAFELGDNHLTVWKVGETNEKIEQYARVPKRSIRNLFQKHRQQWNPPNLLRAKNILSELGPKQLDFCDLGLIPALESQIREKLDRLLKEILQEATKTYKKSTKRDPDIHQLFRLVFRLLAAKILHDREIEVFKDFSTTTPTSKILQKVSRFYSENTPIINDLATQEVVNTKIWEGKYFENLSVEILTYIYENTLVDSQARKKLGIHSTPYSIARYLVHHLIEELPPTNRIIVEPCSGHGIFLVAALQKLHELLPENMSPQKRHEYYVKMFHGYEIEPFAHEVNKICLMLADFPNHNGWKLHQADVFKSKPFISDLKRAGIVLCNPPFEDFSTEEREKYSQLSSFHKPVEVLNRVLDNIPSNCTLGFVLPQKILDGSYYKNVRKKLIERFQRLQLVELPDRIFKHSEQETALLIAKNPILKNSRTSVSFTYVNKKDRQRFLSEYGYTWCTEDSKSLKERKISFAIYQFSEIWKRLDHFSKLEEIATPHIGLQWNISLPKDKRTSKHEKRDYRKGYYKSDRKVISFIGPQTLYLNVEEKHLHDKAIDYPWDQPKVFINARRTTRGTWRYAAFIDYEGVVGSKNFIAIWPNKNVPSLEYLSAVMNNPLANAFVATHTHERDNPLHVIKHIPIPNLSQGEEQIIKQLVNDYINTEEIFEDEHLKNILLKIDAIILKGYALPPRLERKLLDYFSSHQRRVPFDFKEYLPKHFKPYIPLWMYISPEFTKCTPQYILDNIPTITDPALLESLEGL